MFERRDVVSVQGSRLRNHYFRYEPVSFLLKCKPGQYNNRVFKRFEPEGSEIGGRYIRWTEQENEYEKG